MIKKINGLKLGMVSLFLILSVGFVQKAGAKGKHPLSGIWTMEYQDYGRKVICYKLLKKDGSYVNLRSMDKAGKYFYATHLGKYEIAPAEYTEYLLEENGRKCIPPVAVPIKYELQDQNTLKLSFWIGHRKYTEIWRRAKKAPKYG